MEARILVMRCESSGGQFGVRVEKTTDNDWVRKWSFKMKEGAAKSEGYDTQNIEGSLSATDEFPGCPYCGNQYFFKCSCGKFSCYGSDNKKTVHCYWCNETVEITGTLDRFDVGTERF